MIVLCRYCYEIGLHKKHIRWESTLKKGDWVQWETGMMGEYMCQWQGKIIEIGDPDENNYGHRYILIQPQGEKTREWMNGVKLWAYKKENI